MTDSTAGLYPPLPRFVPGSDTSDDALRHDYLGFLVKVAEQCGEIGTYERGGSPVVLVNTPELVRSLLVGRTGDMTKGSLQQTAFRALLGQSLSMSEGARHDALRRILAPLFTRRQVARFAGRIGVTAERVSATWAAETEIDLFAELHRLTVHTLGRCLIGDPSLWDEDRPFWHAREHLWSWINGLAGQRRSLAQPVADTTDADVEGSIGVMQTITDQIIDARHSNADWPDDILSDVLRANARVGHVLNNAEVRDQILALLFAAHETSAAAIFWSMYLLWWHPAARSRVERELETVPTDRPPSATDLAALPYTLQVAKEAMRLYPPAGRQFRVAAQDTSLGRYPLGEGAAVTVCQYVLHRAPASFPDPGRFDPDRFASGAADRHPLSYIPFGAGEHICLGRHYATQEIHLLLVVLLRRFRFEFDERVTAQLAVTVRPSRGVLVRISPVS